MFVKICGITRLGDAEAAVAAGASAVGFIFWPGSPRFIDPYRARAIAVALPPFVTSVGVFVNQPPDYVNGVASLVRLGAVQLHGDEKVADLTRIVRPVVKALAVEAGTEPRGAGAWPGHVTLLLDVHDVGRRGGTGQTIDWRAAAAVAARRRAILAGGLQPDNVADAVARVRPFGIDISSGVEQAPGIKDHGRLRALFEALHGVPDATRS
ncbi:MAG: phosphoribosylanthranilate isomerase [Acidobacteria bacterium]|nr:phosphoribosylanthranilate isomerase [Acidobacteriota bacterium]